MTSLIVSFIESSNHCILATSFLILIYIFFLGFRACGHLLDKLEFIENGVHMLLLFVFGVGGFTSLIQGRVLTFFLWAFSNFLLIDISFKIVLALVASFPTNLVSSNS